MSEKKPLGNERRQRKFRTPTRSEGILVMIGGAAGFVVTLLLWGDQVLCFLGSTLITFLGLGMVIASRYNLAKAGSVSEEDTESNELREAQRRNGSQPVGWLRNPASLSAGESHDALDAVQLPMREGLGPPAAPSGLGHGHTIGEPPIQGIDLLQQVITSLQSNGAQILIENQNQGRAILRITSSEGTVYTGLVYEGRQPAGIAEIRSLQALVNSSASEGGFLFSTALFSTETYKFADARKIRLVTADELDEISL